MTTMTRPRLQRSDPPPLITTSAKDPPDNRDLVDRARANEPGALRELIIRFRPLVERTARRHCASASDAEDVVQEVWIALMNNLDAIHSPACLPGWLRRVTVNAAIQHGRRNSRAVSLSDVPEPHPLGGDDDAGIRIVMIEALRLGVHGALERLKPSERELLELLMAEDRPDYLGISRITQRPVGSIGPTRQRALERLRRDPAILRLATG